MSLWTHYKIFNIKLKMTLFQYQEKKKKKEKEKKKWNNVILVGAQVIFEKSFSCPPLPPSLGLISASLSIDLSSNSTIRHHSPPISSTAQCCCSPSFPLSSLLFAMAIIQKLLQYALMLNSRYVNFYNAQYLGYFSLAPCYASTSIGNLFENFVWILKKYYEHVCLFVLFVCFVFLFFFFLNICVV